MKIMKKSLLVENIWVIFAAAISCATLYSAKAENCAPGPSGPPPGPDVFVLENEPLARIWLYRYQDTNLVQTVDYFTVDGPARFPAQPAKAGVHYLARSGTVTFAVGQNAASVDVPLIDNGLVDGVKDFS